MPTVESRVKWRFRNFILEHFITEWRLHMDLMEMRQQILFGIPSLMSRPVQSEYDPFKVAEEWPKFWQIHHPVKNAPLLARTINMATHTLIPSDQYAFIEKGNFLLL